MVEVELLLSIGWGCRIRDVGRFSRNRVVLVFDPKYGPNAGEIRPWESGRGDSECESVRLTRGSASEVCPIKSGRVRPWTRGVRREVRPMECGRSPSDLLRVIRGRSNGSGETRATALPKPSAALFAQVLLATNCTPARASLRDSLSLGGYALGFPPWAGVSPSPCAAHLPRPPLLWLSLNCG